MATAGDLVVNFLGNSKQLEGVVKGVEGSLSGVVSFAKKALGGLAVGFGIRESIMAAEESEVAFNKLTNAVENQGVALGVTTEEMVAHANALQLVTNFNDEATMGAYELAASFGNIRGDNLKQLVTLSADVATAMGTDITAAASQLSKALVAPANATKILKSMGIVLDKDVAANLKRMTDAGDLAGAQMIILGEVAQRYAGRAEAGASQTKIMSNNFGELAESLGRLINPLLKPLVDITKAVSGNAEILAKVIGSLAIAFGVYKAAVWLATASTVTFKAVASAGVSLLGDAAIVAAAASVAFVGLSVAQDAVASSANAAAIAHGNFVDEMGRPVSIEPIPHEETASAWDEFWSRLGRGYNRFADAMWRTDPIVGIEVAFVETADSVVTEMDRLAKEGESSGDVFTELAVKYVSMGGTIDELTKKFALESDAILKINRAAAEMASATELADHLDSLATELERLAAAGQEHTDEFKALLDEYINATDPIDDVTKAFDLQAEAVKRLKAEETAYLNERKSAADILKGIENDITGIVFGDEAKRKEELQDQGKNPKEIQAIIDAEQRRDRLKAISDKAKKDFETSLFNPEYMAEIQGKEAKRIADLQSQVKSLTQSPAEAMAEKLAEFASGGIKGKDLANVAQALLDQTGLFDPQEQAIQQRGALTAVSGMDAIAAVNQFNAEQERIAQEAARQAQRDAKAAAQRQAMIDAIEANGLTFNTLTNKIEVAGGVQ